MEKKRSLKYLLVAACLALLIVSLGGIVAGAAGDVETSDKHPILGVSLDLNDKISLAYAVDATVAGYNAETGEVENYVYLYDTNPDGTANMGVKVEDYVVRNMKGSDYVIFITDGFAADKYGETKYARVANYETGIYGEVRRGGVMELVSTMKNNIADADPRKALKTNLYDTILAYGEQAYKVIHGTDYPYRAITVEEGCYVDNAGNEWTSGIFKVGDTVTLVDKNNLNLTSVGAKLCWTANGKVTSGSTVTVEDNAVYSPAYIRYADVDTNPYMNTGSSTATNIKANLGFYWGDLRYATLAQGLTATADGYPSTWYDTKTVNFLFNKKNAVQDKIFSVDANGDMSLRIALDKSSYFGSEQQTYETQFYFDNTSVLGTNPSFNFTMNIPMNDKNGNGIYNEYTSSIVTPDTEDPETGDIIPGTTTAVMGDTHTKVHDFNGFFRLHFLFTDRDASAVNEYLGDAGAEAYGLTHASAIGDTPFTIDTVPVFEGNIITGWQMATYAGSDSDNNGTTLPTVYEFGKDYDFEIKFVTDVNGMVTAAEIYVDGVLAGTRTDVCTADKQNKTIYAAGDSAKTKFGFAQIDMGRSNMDVIFSNLEFSSNDYLTAAEVKALDGYGKGSNIYMANYVPSTSGTTGRNIYNVRWNELATLPGVDTFGNYYPENLAVNHLVDKSASWIYDAYTDSVIYKKIGTTKSGRIAIYADNPLKGAEYAAGQAVVFEFEFGMLLNDKDGDGKWNERTQDDALNSQIIGDFYFGYHNNEFFQNPNSRLISFQLRRNNGIQWFRPCLQPSSGSNPYGEVPTWDKQYLAGNVMKAKLVYIPAEDGTVKQVDIYVGGVYLKSYTNTKSTTDGFTYDQSANASLNNLFATKYVGLNYAPRDGVIMSNVFRNVECYKLTDYTTPAN